MRSLLRIVVLILCLTVGYAEPLSVLGVVRYTILDHTTFLYEEGELTNAGFEPAASVTLPYSPPHTPTKAELQPVSGYPVISRTDWSALVAEMGAPALANFSLAPQQFKAAEDTLSFVSWAGSNNTATLTDAPRLANISFRAVVPANGAIIPGFVITSGPTRVLLRVAGPALAAFGVAGRLMDPQFSLFQGTTTLASNDDWETSESTALTEAARRAGAFPLPSGSKDAGLVVVLAPGAYTLGIRGVGGASGEVLFELYEVP